MYIILLYDCYCAAVYVNLFAQIAVLRYPYTRDITIYFTYRNIYRPTRVCVQNIFPTRVQTLVLYYIIITLFAFEMLPFGRFSYRYTTCTQNQTGSKRRTRVAYTRTRSGHGHLRIVINRPKIFLRKRVSSVCH